VRYVTREEWGGARVDRVAYLDPTRVDRIFLHHTTGAQQDDKARWLRSIQRFHIEQRGWSDIGYNLIVDADGVAYLGRGYGRVGAHTRGFNSTSVAIAYLGNGSENVPDVATRAIRRAVEDARLWFGRDLPVYGHRDVGSTTCPGVMLWGWMREGMPVRDPLPDPDVRPFPLLDGDPLRDRSDAPPHLLGGDAVSSPTSRPVDGDGDTRTPSGSRATRQFTVSISPVPDLRDGWRRHLDRMRRRRG